MSDKTLRYMIASVIALLLVFQIGTLITGVFGVVWGAVSAAVVLLVSFFSARLARAGGKSTFWYLVPTFLFIVGPIIFRVWKLMSEDGGWLDRGMKFAPFMIGFGVPIVLLLLVYYELRKRTLEG